MVKITSDGGMMRIDQNSHLRTSFVVGVLDLGEGDGLEPAHLRLRHLPEILQLVLQIKIEVGKGEASNIKVIS